MKMKKLIIIVGLLICSFGCGKTPQPFEIKDVCTQPEGTSVITQGYLSLPKTIDTIQNMKGGKITGVAYQIFLMTKTDATGDAVKVTLWTTNQREPNKIKPLPMNGYTWNDLFVYANDGTEIPAGKLIKITGETVSDNKTGCAVAVTKIELP
jgi:hypothetical protein